MDAYKIANELDSCLNDGSTDLVCVCNAANMLRQQADRIAELERKAKAFEQFCRVATTQIKALQAELETNAEPVGWTSDGVADIPDDGICYQISFSRDAWREGLTPLYTTPQTKPHPKCDEACMYLCQLNDESLIEELKKRFGEDTVILRKSNK